MKGKRWSVREMTKRDIPTMERAMPAGASERRRGPIIETERLVLCPFESSDAPQVERLAGDRRIAETTIAIPHPYEKGMAEAWIATHATDLAEGRALHLAIRRREEGDLIGAIGLVMAGRRSGEAELGYWIGTPFWNRGYCTEAAAALLRYAFTELRLRKVTACHFSRNPASGRVMEKIGMRPAGETKQYVPKWRREEHCLCYAISREAWDAS